MSDLSAAIEAAWDKRDSLNVSSKGAERDAVEAALDGLDGVAGLDALAGWGPAYLVTDGLICSSSSRTSAHVNSRRWSALSATTLWCNFFLRLCGLDVRMWRPNA